MRATLQKFSRWVMRIVGSPRFFYAIVGLLVVQALWIALTARYPQAFDENYHFGLIQLHAQQWLPFFTSQPAGPVLYGQLAHDPSYLYQFLMSIPLRLIELWTQDQTIQIIVLRLINIALFVWGLFVYRKLLDEMKIPTTIRNVALFAFVLLPIVPLLAGQLNYDNLMLPLTGLLFIYVARYIQRMRGRLPSEPLVSVRLLMLISIVGGLGSIVKFAFVPLLLAAIIAVIASTIFYYQVARIKPPVVATGFKATDRFASLKIVLLALSTLLVVGLCFERYGVNMIAYHAPVPKCDKVLTVEECMDYSPWARDYLFAQTYPRPTAQGYAVYPFVWINRMVFETMFTITSYWNDQGTVTYSSKSPLMVGWVVSWVVLGVGVIGAVVNWRQIRRNRPLTVLLAIIAFYTLILFVQNLSMYNHSGEAVAIHGRYLIPVFPVLLVALAIGWRGIMRSIRLTRYQGMLLVVITLLFMQGGGITNWVRRSDASWYWQSNNSARQSNEALKQVIDRTIYKQ